MFLWRSFLAPPLFFVSSFAEKGSKRPTEKLTLLPLSPLLKMGILLETKVCTIKKLKAEAEADQ